MTTSFKPNIRPGMTITGKWKHARYRVERLLGEGSNGKVYLVLQERDRSYCALKVGADAVDLQSEINVLKLLDKEQGRRGALAQDAFLLDVDDLYALDGREYPFYTMKYVRGSTLSDYLKQQGMEWFPLVGLTVLNKLAELHERGWVFGDLKVENVLVADYGYAQLVDFGGVTANGKGIRQFTEIYDRGYWNCGTRTADAKYDLFSYAVLCIHLHESKRLKALTKELLPQNRSETELMRIVLESEGLKPVAGWIGKALSGKFENGREAAEAWRRLMHTSEPSKQTKLPGWLKGLATVSAIVLATSVALLLYNVFI